MWGKGWNCTAGKLRDWEGQTKIYLFFFFFGGKWSTGSPEVHLVNFIWKTVNSSLAAVRSLFHLLFKAQMPFPSQWQAKAGLDSYRGYEGMGQCQPHYTKDYGISATPCENSVFRDCGQWHLECSTNIWELWFWEISKTESTQRFSDTGDLLGEDASKGEGWWDGLWHRESLEEEEEGWEMWYCGGKTGWGRGNDAEPAQIY